VESRSTERLPGGRYTTQALYEHDGIAVRSAPLAFEVAHRLG
jgi:hypothetical protein